MLRRAGYVARLIRIGWTLARHDALFPLQQFDAPPILLRVAGLPARPFWNSSLLGPRFLASAFAAGPAFMILALAIIRRFAHYPIQDETLRKLAMITTVAAQVNLIMLISELFKEFYWNSEK